MGAQRVEVQGSHPSHPARHRLGAHLLPQSLRQRDGDPDRVDDTEDGPGQVGGQVDPVGELDRLLYQESDVPVRRWPLAGNLRGGDDPHQFRRRQRRPQHRFVIQVRRPDTLHGGLVPDTVTAVAGRVGGGGHGDNLQAGDRPYPPDRRRDDLGNVMRSLQQLTVQVCLVQHHHTVQSQQTGLPWTGVPARPVAAEQQPAPPHVGGGGDHLRHAGVVDPGRVGGDTATDARHEQRLLGARQGPQTVGRLTQHPLGRCLEQPAQPFGPLQVRIDQRPSVHHHRHPAGRAASAVCGRGHRVHVNVHHRGLPRPGGGGDHLRPTARRHHPFGQPCLPPVGAASGVGGREEVLEPGHSPRHPVNPRARATGSGRSSGNSRPPPRCRD